MSKIEHLFVGGCFPTKLMARATAAHPSGLHMVMLIKRAFDRGRVLAKGRQRPVVRVSADLCVDWDLTRHMRRRIVAALEAAGLIIVEERRRGAAPLVRFADDVVFPAHDRLVPLPRVYAGSREFDVVAPTWDPTEKSPS
jgi:hypothetical protein